MNKTAHLTNATAQDRREGFAYRLQIVAGISPVPAAIISEGRVENVRTARAVAKEHGATPWNF